ncbi:hypothetical protein PV08_02508 [Exophiala spinifera]|uniref:FAD-binding domain-containing protein n=1 Tax=Exophiala spinifera TaxID=91928 RepID=A0A0D2BHV2_9EURO|nr:uncharacterized protein PV08_02508 [Exophiala spinifera]KIW18220.1 hypothetical protein PV08_02508 [Exophiala spinifera]
MAPFKVIIVGSGLAGNLLANGLLNHDIEVEVYERLARDAKREGYQIRLGENALKGFRACLTTERKQAIISKFGRSSGKFAGAPIIYDASFKPLLDLNRFPNYEKSAAISRKILRDLLAEPLDDIGKIFYDKDFKNYSIIDPGSDDEKVRVRFEDGTFSDCDVLIAADGANSKINPQVGLNNLILIDSHWGFLSKTDLPTHRYMKGDKELWSAPLGCSAAQRSMYYCAYLPDKDISRTAASTAKDGKGAVQHDESISSCFFAYGIPVADVPKDIKEWPLDKQWNFVEKDMGEHWCEKYQEIVKILKGSDLYISQARASFRPHGNVKWRERVRTELTPEKGHPRVMLVGDAIHAMMASRGMGGNQSMRDTAVLLPLLVGLNDKAMKGGLTTPAIEAACKSYEAEMIPRAFSWVEKSGGANVFSDDSSTWMGWLKVQWIGLLLGVAYNVQRLGSLFYQPTYSDDAPEFQG